MDFSRYALRISGESDEHVAIAAMSQPVGGDTARGESCLEPPPHHDGGDRVLAEPARNRSRDPSVVFTCRAVRAAMCRRAGCPRTSLELDQCCVASRPHLDLARGSASRATYRRYLPGNMVTLQRRGIARRDLVERAPRCVSRSSAWPRHRDLGFGQVLPRAEVGLVCLLPRSAPLCGAPQPSSFRGWRT